MLRDALRKTKKVGLGQVVVRGQGSIVAIKRVRQGPDDGDAALRRRGEEAGAGRSTDRQENAGQGSRRSRRGADREEGRDFDPEKFKDTYTVALKELIDAKLEKRPPQEIEETQPATNVINLMDALKRSVKGGAAAERTGNGNGKQRRERARSRQAAARRPRQKTAKRKAGKRAA